MKKMKFSDVLNGPVYKRPAVWIRLIDSGRPDYLRTLEVLIENKQSKKWEVVFFERIYAPDGLISEIIESGMQPKYTESNKEKDNACGRKV